MPELNILPFKTPDLERIKPLQPEDWPDILPNMVFYDSSPFCFPIKVVSGEQIVGIGTTMLHKDTAWLAHIIVHPEFRNHGIGRLITERLIDSLKSYPTIYLIATKMGEPVYRKLGFETETEYVFYKDIKGLPVKESSPDVSAIKPVHISALMQLDFEATGEDRSVLLEPHFNNGYVHLEGGKATGFFLPDLGEGLILASTSKAGIELMGMRFNSKPITAFPVDNLNAHRFLQERGFPELRRAKRMRLGEKREFKAEYVYSRIGGNLG